jgi:hypothetical protein
MPGSSMPGSSMSGSSMSGSSMPICIPIGLDIRSLPLVIQSAMPGCSMRLSMLRRLLSCVFLDEDHPFPPRTRYCESSLFHLSVHH